MPAKKAGTKAQLYRNAGTFGSPNPAALPIRDLKFSDKPAGSFDTSSRDIDVNTKVPTRSEWAVEGEFIWDASDAGLVALVVAATTGRATGIDMIVTDDAIATSGTRGLHAWWNIESGWDLDAKLTDGQVCKFTASPHGNYPAGEAPVRWAT